MSGAGAAPCTRRRARAASILAAFGERCNRFAQEAMELRLSGGTTHLLSSSEGKMLVMVMTCSRLARDLERLGLGLGGVMMVHCRMSALGWVVGGAETVVRALLDALGPDGTLMAYTGWQDEPPDKIGRAHV